MWSRSELLALSQMCAQVNAFSSDGGDEFSVLRENGSRQGIFKTWGIPVIPFLDAGNIRVLATLWPKITRARRANRDSNFWEILSDLACFGGKSETRQAARTAISILNLWRGKMTEQPTRLEQSLERARLYSWLLDERLTRAFRAEPLSENLSLRITQLVNRLLVAFGLMNPFYNLEAIAADPGLLGLEKARTALPHGDGKLDVVAFLLPAAFREWVVAETLNWNGLNWERIYCLTDEMLTDPLLKKILLNLSREAGLPPRHIVFAANALEWIPSPVGGKKSDLIETNVALEQLERAVTQPKPERKDVVSVLSAMNSLIRFLNWVPLIEGEENFSGRNWTYASVCNASSLLLQTLTEHPEVWQEGFAEVFGRNLRPQLANLDAASARGRFLLHLILEEHRLKRDFFHGVDATWQDDIIARIAARRDSEVEELQNPTHNVYPISLVGGKPVGLALASYTVGEQRVPDGFVLSTSTVEDFLREDPSLWELILQLDRAKDLPAKQILAQEIEAALIGQPVPGWFEEAITHGLNRFPQVDRWAIRSSALDEGEARGIYESMLGVPRQRCLKAVKECIASYYSEEGILFRVTSGCGDLPCFAVLFQPYLEEEGGVAEVRSNCNGVSRIRVAVGRTAAEVTSAVPGSREWGGIVGVDEAPTDIAEVVELLRQLASTFGPLQLEWAKEEGTVAILQMEFLPASSTSETRVSGEARNVVKIPSLANIQEAAASMATLDGTLALDLGPEVELDSFQGRLLALIVQFGERIVEVRAARHVSPSSHFASICRHFGINISS